MALSPNRVETKVIHHLVIEDGSEVRRVHKGGKQLLNYFLKKTKQKSHEQISDKDFSVSLNMCSFSENTFFETFSSSPAFVCSFSYLNIADECCRHI